jgi:DHA1 family arabinose polymer transporter-like MFS transporter
LGAFFGGLPLVYGFDYTSPAYVGAAMALIGAFFAFWLIKSKSNNNIAEPKQKYAVMH